MTPLERAERSHGGSGECETGMGSIAFTSSAQFNLGGLHSFGSVIKASMG